MKNILLTPDLWPYIEQGIKKIAPQHLDEIRQICLVKILKKSTKSEFSFTENEIKSYLITIGKNTAITYLKQLQTRKKQEKKYAESLKREPIDYQKSLFVEISSAKLQKAIKKLPIEQQRTIILFHFDGYSYEEISAMQGISKSAVGQSLSKGRRNLKKMLEKKE